MKKLIAITIFGIMTLGAAATPTDRDGSLSRDLTTPHVHVYPVNHHTWIMDHDYAVDVADTSDDLRTVDLDEMEPNSMENRDFDEEIERTYDQSERIESDYGNEIEDEIIDNAPDQ